MNDLLDTTAAILVDQPIRTERTTRILDAAAALLLRWGYKRVTIEDIAQQAAVGTGTIYLHWKTKEILFETVLLRELVAIWRALLQRIRANPAEALLHRFMNALLVQIKERPLACALFTQDVALLGKLTHSHVAKQTQQVTSSHEWIVLLRRLGLLRTDSPTNVQAYAWSAIWIGFVLADQLLTEDSHADLRTQSEALVQTIRSTFEPDILPAADTLHNVVAPTVIAFLEQACASYEQQIAERSIAPKDTQIRS